MRPLAHIAVLFAPAAAALSGGAAFAQEPIDDRRLARFEVDAPDEVQQTLARVLESIRRADVVELEIDRDDDERRLRRLRELVIGALATEGYFTPTLEARPDGDGTTARPGATRYVVRIDLGPRARVESVELVFRGAIETDSERRETLTTAWELPRGAPFRDAQWNQAKNRLMSRTHDKDYAAAQLITSSAEVDVENSTVALRVEIDSGPAFRVGELQVKNLKRFDRDLVERFNPFQPGDRYDATALLEFQRRMQSSPYFASVRVSVEPDPALAQAVPIVVEVTEAQTKRAQFSVGYSTNTGPRLEATYRQALIFNYPYTFQTGVGFDQTRSIVYADVLLPPKPNGALDSLGVLFERSDIENVILHRWGAGAGRTRLRELESASIETKVLFNLQRELRRFADAPSQPSETNDVLSGTWQWTRRAVDDVADPRRGNIFSVALSAGVGRDIVQSLSDNTFTRAYSRLSIYMAPPFVDPRRNVLILRGEIGRVFTDNPSFIPSDFLFRTGGAGSLRGYSYQTIGRRSGTRRAGSTALAVGSIEAVHWFTSTWGGALFFDVGDAADDFDQMRQPGRDAGFGVRWKTLAGPIALDAAYGERRPEDPLAPPPQKQLGGRWRLSFSVAIAF